MHKYKELEIWKKSVKMAVSVCKLTNEYPEEEKFGLVSQMRRSAVSVASNIAEGAGRGFNKSFSSFLGVSAGSLFELETQAIISNEVGFLGDEELAELQANIDHITNMTFKLKSSLSSHDTKYKNT